jgi:hypothetical protein
MGELEIKISLDAPDTIPPIRGYFIAALEWDIIIYGVS